jgi:hypothetical protein
VELDYHKHFTRRLPVNVEAKSYATRTANSVSALDAGIWLAEANVAGNSSGVSSERHISYE